VTTSNVKRLRRFFAFLFTHDYSVTRGYLNKDEVRTELTCNNCGSKADYPTFNKAMFVEIYRERGCKGKS